MAAITSLEIEGYRAIGEAVRIDGAGAYVALYGDNAVGKTTVLQAIELVGALLSDPTRWMPGREWGELDFYAAFRQDPWMFHHGRDRLRLEATWSSGACTRFVLERADGWLRVGADLRFPDAEPAPWEALATASSTEANRALFARKAALKQHTSPIALTGSPSQPVSDDLRRRFVSALSSPDVQVRKRARRLTGALAGLFPALGPGALDVLDNTAQGHPADLAWVGDRGIVPLDRLGGGVQSAIATLAQLALAGTPIVCMDEPEAFLGQRALVDLGKLFEQAVADGICDQVWVATHAVALAPVDHDVHLFEERDGRVEARRAPRRELARLTPDVDPPHGPTLGRLGVDGSVRLPPSVREQLGLVVGEPVHFFADGSGVRLVSVDDAERILRGEDG